MPNLAVLDNYDHGIPGPEREAAAASLASDACGSSTVARVIRVNESAAGRVAVGKDTGRNEPATATGGCMKFAEDRLRLSASDVANFVACQHMTRLDLLEARGRLHRPRRFDVGFEDLVQRGEEHERIVLEQFRADGRQVVEINPSPSAETAAAQATREAIRGGADVIYQGVLLGGSRNGGTALLGRPDFLVRAGLLAAPDGEPRPGGLHYEVVDAKLARTAKARAVAQTAFYSHLLAELQQIRPRWMHLALGQGELVPLKVSDYAAYERQARRALGAFIAADPGHNPPADPYPEPVEHCVICRWDDLCQDRRRRDDDLSLVAGITKDQRRTLKASGVSTRCGLASLAVLPGRTQASRDSLAGARLQAQLQVASEDEGRIRYELLDPERDQAGALLANRGLLALPEPADGDLFFDIEGARYYSEDNKEFGLQYLFGIVDTADTDARGRPRYTQIWAFDRQDEKRAFEELIDFITERRRRHPGLRVYHYNHYEPTSVDHLTELHGTRQEAVGWLMGRFATREDEVDDLFRRGVFVDLYRVVRQGVRAGVESYSIKRLEPLCGYTRQMDLRQATENLITFEAALEDGTARDAGDTKAVVAAYNEDDCRATLALRDWLEQLRAELAGRLGEDLPRPAAVPEPESTEDPEVTRIRAALLAGLPAADAERTGEQKAKALLADLLDWHRRDAKPQWWRYFYVRTLSAAELIDEPDALGGLTGGEVVGQVKRSVLRRFSFPPQEYRFKRGDCAVDPVCGRGFSVWDVDDEHGTIDLKVGQAYEGPWPAALVEDSPVNTRVLAERLRDLGDRVVREGVTGQDAGTALLLRLRPDAGGGPAGPLRGDGEAADRCGGPARAGAARLLPADPGTTRNREDVHRRPADPRAHQGRAHRRDHRPFPRRHTQPDRRGHRAGRRAGSCPAAHRPASGSGHVVPASGRGRPGAWCLGERAAGRGSGRGRGYGLGLGPRAVPGQRRHAVRRRGRPDVTGQHPGRGRRGPEPRPARRPTATGSAEPGGASARGGRVRAGAHSR